MAIPASLPGTYLPRAAQVLCQYEQADTTDEMTISNLHNKSAKIT